MSARICVSGALLTMLYGAASHADSPPAFSADIVKRDARGAAVGPPGKLRVRDGKTRIDTPDAEDGFFLTDSTAGTAVFVRSAQPVFMDAKQSTPLTRVFVRVDPHDPCPQWRAASLIADAASAKTWHCAATQEAARIDSALQFPIAWRTPDGGTVRLENIRREVPPAELFAVPAGYRKLNAEALLERIKHSDVWAPAPDGR
jgi:hypothetical protein